MKMHSTFKIFLLLILFGQSIYLSFGQLTDNSLERHNLVVAEIDSICSLIDNNKELTTLLSEGFYVKNRKGWSTSHKIEKPYGVLYRIYHTGSEVTEYYYRLTFYYYNMKVIKAMITIEDWKLGKTPKTIYSANYYYDNENVIKAINEDINYSNSFDILKRGKEFQENYYNKR
jgi:hypothetical protein